MRRRIGATDDLMIIRDFSRYFFKAIIKGITPHITGSKKHSEERAALFDVRVYVIVMFILWLP